VFCEETYFQQLVDVCVGGDFFACYVSLTADPATNVPVDGDGGFGTVQSAGVGLEIFPYSSMIGQVESMAGKPPVHYPGALYHVMVRGNNGEKVLLDEMHKL
jgi:hypothetical protein